MNPSRPSLRFDHREIAVIFSLFIFVSLLMFTVGILVGKGLALARYDRIGTERTTTHRAAAPTHDEHTSAKRETETKFSSGTSVSTQTPAKAKAPERLAVKESPVEVEKKEEPPVKWVPQKPKEVSVSGSSLLEAPAREPASQSLLKDPKIRSLIEEDGPGRKSGSETPPTGATSGKFAVQVGSYVDETDAAERVKTLKNLGFPNAHFSAKQLGENNETWYRVWLGYFPDYQSADKSGKYLKDRGEVKHYLVRKSEN